MKKRFRKIYVEITNRCNLNCKFCLKSKRSFKDMSCVEFKEVIDKIKDYTNLITLHVKGEPLLHKDLDEILNVCDQNNIMVNITTNGTLLKSKCDMLKKHKCVRQINISLHSIIQNDFSNDVATKYLDDVVFSSNKLSENCIISYRIWNIQDISKNGHNDIIINELKEEYGVKNLNNILKQNMYYKLKDNIYINQDMEFKWPNIKDKKTANNGKCRALKDQIAILSNGDVAPCCLDQDANINLGNIFENSIEEILNTEKVKNIIKGFNENNLVEELCKKCKYIKKFNK